jgi:outer membrane protein
VKGGAGYLMPKGNPGSIEDNGTKLNVEVDDAWSLVFTVGYMFDEHWALELLGSGPFQHDINVRGIGKVGETKLLPPTVSALYYFNPGGKVKPYLGAGVNFTEFYGEKPSDLHLKGSIGPAAAGGIDYLFDRHWSATVDLRYAYVRTDVRANGSSYNYGSLQLNPVVVSLMVGYRFGGREPPSYEAPAK